MSNKILFPIVILIALIGGLGLLHLSSSLPDQDKVNNEVSNHLLEIENLNSTLNQLALKSRLNIDTNYDALASATNAILSEMRVLSETHFNEDKIGGTLLEERFNEFRSAIEVKIDHIENFKSSNSVLRNSDRYVPIVGKELIQISNAEGLENNAQLYEDIIIDTLIFSKQNDDETYLDVSSYAEKIAESESVMPVESTVKLIEFSNHVSTIGESKKNTDGYLERAMLAADIDSIQEIQSAWGEVQIASNKKQDLLRYYSIAYVIVVLSLIAWLVARLRNSYKNLDNEVKLKTDEVKSAYEDLRVSEKRLSESEKMASLGQLIAGVANQVNAPLAFASSNVGVVKSKLSSFLPVFDSVKELGDTIIEKRKYDNETIRNLISKQVRAYSKVKAVSHDDLLELLNDSSEGLSDIQEAVQSLTDYSYVDEDSFEEISVDQVIRKALNECVKSFGHRKVSFSVSKNPFMVIGVFNHLTQVMINVINNAIDATKDIGGVVSIKTELYEDRFVKILVKDNGSGIDESIKSKVLDPFFTTKDVGEGTGLGLSICNQIVLAHDGQITIDSDEGTVISIVLPIASQEIEENTDNSNFENQDFDGNSGFANAC